jgi:hypothetical protein
LAAHGEASGEASGGAQGGAQGRAHGGAVGARPPPSKPPLPGFGWSFGWDQGGDVSAASALILDALCVLLQLDQPPRPAAAAVAAAAVAAAAVAAAAAAASESCVDPTAARKHAPSAARALWPQEQDPADKCADGVRAGAAGTSSEAGEVAGLAVDVVALCIAYHAGPSSLAGAGPGHHGAGVLNAGTFARLLQLAAMSLESSDAGIDAAAAAAFSGRKDFLTRSVLRFLMSRRQESAESRSRAEPPSEGGSDAKGYSEWDDEDDEEGLGGGDGGCADDANSSARDAAAFFRRVLGPSEREARSAGESQESGAMRWVLSSY